ncbi:NDR1/HIN1-like protein 12 [Dichanthelium oligosanthes]|uniref:NDR1/HIN1-like protein 12 n=1 Tax=Dichanthelium oligosanthes TaxID=888268 RepID=A0A1E5VM68_9POAL|nr:NDR1/HIN1-like protein 12 [Dichanthelium oligosanthes]
MSKEEKHHRHEHRLRRCCGCMASCLLALVLIVALVALIVYLALRPSKPSFYLQDLQLRRPITLGDPSLSASAQVTLASRNPNDHVGIFYRRLDVFVTYRDEPVTVPVSLPPQYQGHRDVTVWSPVLSAQSVPVAAYVADAMKQDVAAGFVSLQVKVDGRVKWKVGSWVSGSYHLFVSCPAVLSAGFPSSAFGGGNNATLSSLKFAQPTGCSVEV